MLGDNRNLQAVIEQLREQLDEEQERRADLQRQLTRANNETSVWRQKFESGEGGIPPEEMDDLKKKFGARILDGEAQLEAALAKAIGLEKAKNRSQMEIEALVAEIEKVGIIIFIVFIDSNTINIAFLFERQKSHSTTITQCHNYVPI